jgi:hypothetical protein
VLQRLTARTPCRHGREADIGRKYGIEVFLETRAILEGPDCASAFRRLALRTGLDRSSQSSR